MTSKKRRLRGISDAEEVRIQGGIAADLTTRSDHTRLPAGKAVRQNFSSAGEKPGWTPFAQTSHLSPLFSC